MLGPIEQLNQSRRDSQNKENTKEKHKRTPFPASHKENVRKPIRQRLNQILLKVYSTMLAYVALVCTLAIAHGSDEKNHAKKTHILCPHPKCPTIVEHYRELGWVRTTCPDEGKSEFIFTKLKHQKSKNLPKFEQVYFN